MTDVQTPWFLAGNYGPVQDELTVHDLAVTGAIPPSLSGRYLRNGSNPASGTAAHWFFGDGMVHGIRLEGGRASWYRNRWVRTTKLDKHLEATDPETMMDPTASAANTHVLAHAGRIWALEEGHLPYELSPELETLGCDDFGGRLTTAFTAHPKLCPETGELHFFGYGVLPPYLTYHVLDAEGALVHTAPITVPGPTMMHDFMITRDHAIFMDLPVTFDLEKAMTGDIPLGWDDSYGARIGIMPRLGTDADVQWFDVDPCYVFHPLNAFVDGTDGSSKVVCDVGRHEYMWRDSMEDFAPCYLHRWTFDLDAGTVREQQLDDVSHAFPRVDDRVVGLPHRFGWAAAPRPGEPGGLDAPGVVVKYDLAAGDSEVFDLGPTAHPGEFVFVRESDTSGEDEGWAMGLVYDDATEQSELVILDASDPAAEPVARVHLPRRIPYGFHGSWISDAELVR
ncbi:MAG: carotenoid oxygenase family protein [Ilumatobacteraceae bacterium]